MAVSAAIYADNNKDRYPIAYHTEEGKWRYGFLRVGYDDDRRFKSGSWLALGRRWQQANPAMPSFIGGANWLVDPYTGYNYNTSYIGHGDLEDIVQPAKTGRFRIPR